MCGRLTAGAARAGTGALSLLPAFCLFSMASHLLGRDEAKGGWRGDSRVGPEDSPTRVLATIPFVWILRNHCDPRPSPPTPVGTAHSAAPLPGGLSTCGMKSPRSLPKRRTLWLLPSGGGAWKVESLAPEGESEGTLWGLKRQVVTFSRICSYRDPLAHPSSNPSLILCK